MDNKNSVGNNSNGRITLAKIGQRLEDYIEHNNKTLEKLQSETKETREAINELKNMMAEWQNRVYQNEQAICEHKNKHYRERNNSLKMIGIFASLVSAGVSVMIFLLTTFLNG